MFSTARPRDSEDDVNTLMLCFGLAARQWAATKTVSSEMKAPEHTSCKLVTFASQGNTAGSLEKDSVSKGEVILAEPW